MTVRILGNNGQKHEGGLNLKNGVWSGSESFQLLSDSPATDREYHVYQVMLDEKGIYEGGPHPDPYFASLGVKCRGLTHNRAGAMALGLWAVSVEWSNGPESKEEKERRSIPNPLLRPPGVEGIVIREVVPGIKDSEDLPYENTAGDPLEYEQERERDQIRITVNLPEVPVWYRGLRRTVNASPLVIGAPVWASMGARCVRYIPGGFSKQLEENGFEFVSVTFLLDIDEDEWDVELANRGYNCLELPDTKSSKVPYLVKGLPANSPQWLDESGLASDDPYYVTRKPFYEADYGDIQEILNRI